MSEIRLGISLFSFSDEYYKYQFSLEDCIAKAAKLGAQGIEIVAPQMVKGYPCPSEEFITSVRSCCEKNNIELYSYGAYPDRGMRSDRDLSEEELFQAALTDLIYAQKFGCKNMRELNLLSPRVFERLIPYAEAYDVKIGLELHNPETYADPMIRSYLDVMVRSGSPYVGFIQDFGAYMEHPYKLLIDEAIDMGGHKDIINMIIDATWNEMPLEEIAQKAAGMGANEIDKTFLGPLMKKRFKPADYEGFQALLPYTHYFHGKFYYIDENLFDSSIPYHKLIPLIKESEFNGYIMSEYEGHYHGPRVDTVEMLKRHHAMIKML